MLSTSDSFELSTYGKGKFRELRGSIVLKKSHILSAPERLSLKH